MKKFSFRLKSLLKIREIYEQEAERNFREAINDLTLKVEELTRLKDEFSRILIELTNKRNDSVEQNIEMLYTNYIKSLRVKTDIQLERIKEAEEFVEQRRVELLEAMQDRKTIENLQTRDYDIYLQDLRRFEQSVIDELTMLRYAGKEMKKNEEVAS